MCQLQLDVGETIFVLGANGSGKSSLMHRFYTDNHAHAHRISAHRQTWFNSNASDLSPNAKINALKNITNTDTQARSRYSDDYSAARSSIAIDDLVGSENVRARAIARAADAGRLGTVTELAKKGAPVRVINDLLRQSNIPVEISIEANETVIARKAGGAPYSIAELSDGERNALLVAASVLTVQSGTVLLIDEPERHLHRSIISPLLSLLFETRTDCAFIVSTHDLLLPIDNPGARALLVRSCVFAGSAVQSWEADLLAPPTVITEELKRDVMGSRRKILFVEGNGQSLDEALYSLVFPNVSVVPKEGCRSVEAAVGGIRGSEGLHWVRAWGLIDNDGRSPEEIERLADRWIFALPCFSVESIYYHPEILRRVAKRHAAVTGADAAARVSVAEAAARTAVASHVPRMCARVVERSIREQVMKQLPTADSILAHEAVNVRVDVVKALEHETELLRTALANADTVGIIARYPIRETPALNELAKQMGFQGREQYESAVRKLLIDDETALAFVRSLIPSLVASLGLA